MDPSLPLYLVGSVPEDMRAGLREEIEGAPSVRDVLDLTSFPGPDDPPGWVALASEADPGELLALLERLVRLPGPWSPFLVRVDAEDTWILPLSPGLAMSAEDAGRRIRVGGSEAGTLSLRGTLAEVARLRHDINNPLTAALAEVQLLLLDVEPGGEEEMALGVVETQLKRIRDLVAELSGFRVPKG